MDYLLKPVRQERLVEALEHARRLTRVQAGGRGAGMPVNGPAAAAVAFARGVRGGLQLVRGQPRFAIFLADQKYVTVCTADARSCWWRKP